ncbi:MAG: modification methylase [Rhodobacter sp.]|nr:modification methylase [Rhodobacter sp.]MCA3514304.1 modification methylase [Rhodobacter sp.]MCA3519017.1 modification methylase [Rhodobacter sp.]MCA3522462.1 modification methylase [Rhodobacter sp.]MCA3529675.1 modification methylase [Rhodobacter sp.]
MGSHPCCGDNLGGRRGQPCDALVDVICPDPPFSSNTDCSVLFKLPSGAGSTTQMGAFDDTRHWNESAGQAFGEVGRSGRAASEMLRASQLSG